jgi:hypothetical protein
LPEPLNFTANANFKQGDIGWAVHNGTVIHPRDLRPAEHLGAYIVSACDDCPSGAVGKFVRHIPRV